MSTRLSFTLILAAALAAPSGLSAQSPSLWQRQRIETAGLAPARSDAAQPAIATSAGGTRREGRVLMIVGVAGIVTGLIIDEDIVTIAGVGVAGFGLYLYLNSGGSVTVSGRRAF